MYTFIQFGLLFFVFGLFCGVQDYGPEIMKIKSRIYLLGRKGKQTTSEGLCTMHARESNDKIINVIILTFQGKVKTAKKLGPQRLEAINLPCRGANYFHELELSITYRCDLLPKS